jgi:hypothetical protein
MILILMRSAVLHAADDSKSTDVPRDLTNQFTEGEVLEVQELLGDGEIVYIAVAQFGDLFVITRARPTEDGYAFNKQDILEIFMLVDGKPKSLWVRQSGV